MDCRGPRADSETCHVKSNYVESSRVGSGRVGSSRVESSRVESSRVESSRVESSRVESSRVESSRVESSRVESESVKTINLHDCREHGLWIEEAPEPHDRRQREILCPVVQLFLPRQEISVPANNNKSEWSPGERGRFNVRES
jgi:hypothetical protein